MTPQFDDPDVAAWFERRTFRASDRSLAELVGRKRELGTRISVCLPALDEATTIGAICRTVRSMAGDGGLVDELVVVDTGSSDETVAVAEEEGAAVYLAGDILGGHGAGGGKGAALWKSLAVTTGDIVVWFDSDTKNFNEHFVTGLIAPLLFEESIVFTKAFYNRPLARSSGELSPEGARVTELLARPLIHLLYPPLVALVQPLSGEYAGRREAMLDLPFYTGYGVDIGLVIDVVEHHGLDALAQVDLGTRVHRNRNIAALGRTAFEVAQALLMKLDAAGRLKLGEELTARFVQWRPGEGHLEPAPFDLAVTELPPMREAMGA